MDKAEFDLIIQTVREFIAREVIPREDEIEETDAIPERVRQGAIELGLWTSEVYLDDVRVSGTITSSKR